MVVVVGGGDEARLRLRRLGPFLLLSLSEPNYCDFDLFFFATFFPLKEVGLITTSAAVGR